MTNSEPSQSPAPPEPPALAAAIQACVDEANAKRAAGRKSVLAQIQEALDSPRE